MGSLYLKPIIELGLAQVGNECGKTNPYSAELDSVNYFNGKKNGVANSCSIFQCWLAYRNTLDADLQPHPDKYDAYYFLYQPSSSRQNCGAGCTQQAGYFKNGGAWYQEPDACTGDWLFYTNDGGNTYYHVGLVIDWGEYPELGGKGGYKVLEGNTDGGYVAIHYVPFGDSRIGGFGRPRYDGYELNTAPTPEPEPEPSPNPGTDPEPTPEPSVRLFRVRTNSGSPLRLRAAPNIDSACLGLIPNGTVIAVSKVVNGEMINWNEEWAYTTFNGYTGYASCAYLIEE